MDSDFALGRYYYGVGRCEKRGDAASGTRGAIVGTSNNGSYKRCRPEERRMVLLMAQARCPAVSGSHCLTPPARFPFSIAIIREHLDDSRKVPPLMI